MSFKQNDVVVGPGVRLSRSRRLFFALLLAMLGAWGGWQTLPLTILLSSLVGAVLGLILFKARGAAHGSTIPFGPYLAIAGWIALIWGDAITQGYLHFAGF